MFLRFTHVEYISTLFLSIVELFSIVWIYYVSIIHSPIGRHWIASSFDFQEQQHYEHLQTILCVYISFHFPGRMPRDGFPGLYVSVCLTF